MLVFPAKRDKNINLSGKHCMRIPIFYNLNLVMNYLKDLGCKNAFNFKKSAKTNQKPLFLEKISKMVS